MNVLLKAIAALLFPIMPVAAVIEASSFAKYGAI
jgi:hypothetical protein